MTDDKITALVARLRRTSGFLEEYEFEGAASEAAGLMNEAADALEASVQAPAVDREALIALAVKISDDENHEDLCHCPLWPQDCSTYGTRRPWSHNGERLIEIALDNLTTSGILLDAAEVEARGLEKFAEKVYNGAEATRERNFQAFYNYGLNPVLMAEAQDIRARAQQVREGTA